MFEYTVDFKGKAVWLEMFSTRAGCTANLRRGGREQLDGCDNERLIYPSQDLALWLADYNCILGLVGPEEQMP